MKLKPKFSNTKIISRLYKLKRSLILTMHQIKILFMTANNSRIAGPKQGKKSRICFKASSFCVKLTICKHMQKFCQLYLFRKKLISLSIHFLSTDEIQHFDGNFINDSKHILNLQTLNIYHRFQYGKRVFKDIQDLTIQYHESVTQNKI